jgi:DNA-binding NtrC family response regulator
MSREKRILIIDPDLEIQNEFAALLSEEGYDTETVSRISEAVNRIRKVPIACIVMDANLAVMNGCDAVPIIKAISSRIPIIMTASANTKDFEAKIRAHDVFYYYIKTFDRKELNAAVKNALELEGRRENEFAEDHHDR